MQTASFKIRTQLAEFISDVGNQYAMINFHPLLPKLKISRDELESKGILIHAYTKCIPVKVMPSQLESKLSTLIFEREEVARNVIISDKKTEA